MSIESIEDKKKKLRKEMKRLRLEKGGSDKEIAKNFFSLWEIQNKNTFFVYNAFGAEAGTMPVIERLLNENKQVFLPRVEGKDMVAVEYTRSTPLSVSDYGIEEPIGQAYEGEIQVTVLPLLAADTNGNRLGYGGGYYDKFLQNRKSLKIGYCYDFQVLNALTCAPHDIKLDVIVTDKRIIRIKEF